MDILLTAGADPAAIDDQGKSVLHQYAERDSYPSDNKLKMINIFMQKGAQVDQKDNDGKTPLDYAQQNHNRQLIDLFTLQLDGPVLIKPNAQQPTQEKVLNNGDSVIDKIPPSVRLRGGAAQTIAPHPISYKKIVAMSGFLLLSMATIYYFLKNIDYRQAAESF